MAIGTNDAIRKVGTQVTVEANGGSCANNAVVQANDATYGVLTDGVGAPDGIFDLAVAYTSAPVVNTTIDVYAAEQDINSTNDADPVTATFKPLYIGSFVVNATGSSTVQYLRFYARNLPILAYYWLYNNATGQTINSGWILKITPTTIGPSA